MSGHFGVQLAFRCHDVYLMSQKVEALNREGKQHNKSVTSSAPPPPPPEVPQRCVPQKCPPPPPPQKCPPPSPPSQKCPTVHPRSPHRDEITPLDQLSKEASLTTCERKSCCHDYTRPWGRVDVQPDVIHYQR